ncbi:MAG: hypothetical protein COV47_05850 [Candidatus Diapherotrites archaeon CG11_big_fil_rev_8_21_14_0_20_37_9]|nr:MAG: hypothetical protein COV47_05850 [Candidatus Diapherotrites archaeon CG11_big_fil_rev_8_21_14_0_20_37_9]
MKKKIKITKTTAEGNMRFFSGEIRQLNQESLILKDRYNQLVMIKYSQIEHIQSIEGELE